MVQGLVKVAIPASNLIYGFRDCTNALTKE